jgi:enamine deaminase RidA (YjgF/YER057c/UK114 family)
MFAPVGHLLLEEWHLETKTELDDIIVPTENAATIATFTWGPVDELESVERNILDELKEHVICEISVSPTKHGIPNRFAYVCARMSESVPKQGVYESPYLQMRALFEVLNNELTSRLQLAEPTKHMLQNVLVVRNMGDFSEINRAYSQYFGVSPPSRVCIECNTIQGCVTIESVLQISNADFTVVDYDNTDASVFAKKVLHVQSVSEWAPACIGPYSQATVMCNIIRSAGQVALLPQTMNIVDASVKTQAIQCMKNVHHTLTALNSCIHNVVRCVLYVDGENVTEESDKKVVESVGTWNNYLASTDDDYVEQYKRSDVPSISDFFKVVYVSKLPKLSAVEYHTTALNNKGGKATLTTLESAYPLRAQKLVIQDTYSETTFIAVSIIGNDSIEDSLVEKVAGYANSAAKKESVKIQICRVFTKSTSLGISAQLAEWAAIQGIPFSVVPCTRLALLDGQECQLCCEFEVL